MSPGQRHLQQKFLDRLARYDKPLDFEKALKLIPNEELIHTYKNPSPGMLLGADWRRKDIIELIQDWGCGLAGPGATAHGHGIVVYIDQDDTLFVKTNIQQQEEI
jgi:hypothetical protein